MKLIECLDFQIQDYPILRAIKNDKAKKPAYGLLKTTVDEDREFLQEITLLNGIADQVYFQQHF